MRRKLFTMMGVLGVLVFAIRCGDEENKTSNDSLSNSSPVPSGDIVYVAPNEKIFEDAGVIQKWVDDFDDQKIDDHAWELWGGITALTDQMYPSADTAKKYNIDQVPLAVFSTWWSEYEVFNPPPADTSVKRNIMPLHSPRQAPAESGKVTVDAHSGDVFSFNKYTQEFKDYVAKNGFNTLKALCDLKKANVDSIPMTFEAKKSMMLKPSFIFASSTEPVLVPYWKGPGMVVDGTTDPDRPVSTTWTQWVLFNPTGTPVKPGTAFTTKYADANGAMRDTTITDWKEVGRKDFYYLPLTLSNIAYIQAGNIFTTGGIDPSDLKVGDLALMVACHVTSIEFFEDWTWQTFWWSPNPAKVPPASANVKGPFAHYDMMPCYYMMDKSNQPFISQNPYLEPSIISPIVKYDNFSKGLGVRSNCMSCHHSAAFPTANLDPSPAHMLIGSYIGSGQVDRTNPIFGPMNNRRVNTNFMWTMVLLNQPRSTPDGRDSLSIYLNNLH